jgi:hypothetical protein
VHEYRDARLSRRAGVQLQSEGRFQERGHVGPVSLTSVRLHDAKGAVAADDRRMAERLHLELELELTEPITGRLIDEGGNERRLTGWLELHAALDAAYTEAKDRLGHGEIVEPGRAPS